LNLLDLLDYVDKNPEDYEKRWSLAKKLYQNKDYTLALEHLTVLKNEWEPYVNVYRFISATLYRLGKYDEAIEELKKAIKIWEKEPGLYEQLGRVLITVGKYEEAKEVYEKLIKICPEHRWAPLAVEKLKKFLDKKTVKKTPFPFTFNSDFDLLPETVCRRCGAENQGDNDRCWRCSEPLDFNAGQPASTTVELQQNLLVILTPEIITIFLGLITIASLAIDIFMSLQFWFTSSQSPHISLTFWDIYCNELFPSRVITGIVFLILSPIILKLGLNIIGIREKIPPNLIILVGLLIPALIFLFSWLPKSLIIWGLTFIPFISFLIIFGTFGISILKTLNLCLFHLLVLLLLAVISFSAVESYILNIFINPFTQIPTTVRFFRDQHPPHTIELKSPDGSSLIHNINFKSTGSYWLDMRTKKIKLELFLDSVDTFTVEVNKGETKPIIYNKFHADKWETPCLINTNETFTIKIFTENHTPFTALIKSLYIITIL